MKAAVLRGYGDPDVLRYDDVTTPAPGPGQVLVRVLAAGLNRLDHYLREGSVTRDLAWPHVLGSDAAGVVEAVGAGAARFSVGDRVIPMPGYPLDPAEADVRPISAAPSYAIRGIAEWGAYAQFMVVPEQWLLRDDTGLAPEQAATLPMTVVTSVRAVRGVGGVGPGSTVLVHAGASGTGSMAVQVARALGARVIATVRTATKADFVRGLGAERVIDLHTEDFVARTLDWAGGRGVDVVIDNLGGDVLGRSLGALRPEGVLVSIGFVAGLEAGFNVRGFFFAQQQIRGSLMGDASDLEWGLDQVRQGTIRPTLDRAFPLAQAAEAHRHLAAGAARGNTVLLPWES